MGDLNLMPSLANIHLSAGAQHFVDDIYIWIDESFSSSTTWLGMNISSYDNDIYICLLLHREEVFNLSEVWTEWTAFTIMQLVVTVVMPGWTKAYHNYKYVVTTQCIMVNTVCSSLFADLWHNSCKSIKRCMSNCDNLWFTVHVHLLQSLQTTSNSVK